MNLDLALIGNCNIGALVDDRANIVWCCMPRFDSTPVFDCLLRSKATDTDEGIFAIELLGWQRSEQRYLRNTAVLQTTMYDDQGGSIEITDFAPRFRAWGRMFTPMMLVRQLRRLTGTPRIRVRLRPSFEYGASKPDITFGSNHVRYVNSDIVLRLTTDLSITNVREGLPFVLDGDHTMVLGPDETLDGALADVGNSFRGSTSTYWRDWVRYLAIPFEWQSDVIRAAITLKLNAFDDTGAIIAAMTTSIPEVAHSGRNWDYRFCWLRDAYFVVTVLGRLGTTQTMERYLDYIINIIAQSQDGKLQPVYQINGSPRLDEFVVENLDGYRNMGPVRVGNEAYQQIQHDVYGAAILAAAHVFFDERLDRLGDEDLFRHLEPLGEHAARYHDAPDAGPWELRGKMRVHTYSSVMCWAACDRLARIAARLGMTDRQSYWRGHADRIHQVICERAWNKAMQSFVSTFDGSDLDASLLLLPQLDFIEAGDERFLSTLAAVEQRLVHKGLLFRYVEPDDFGTPETAFTICSFWYVDALAAVGREKEARTLFERLLAARNPHGLLSEDIDFESGELWGNFPQTYSMVGLIDSALRLSENWEDAF
jgi:GH15 family glucan-1,4-alpha-glucosidase